MSSIFLISSLLYIIAGGITYFQRGGGIFDINSWLKSKGLPGVRNLLIVGILELPIITMVYLILNGVDIIHAASISYAFGIGYVLAWMQGWGSYFDTGSYTEEYNNHREILWIDYVLYRIFGALWIPTYAQGHIKETWDLKPSPSGELRPVEWRWKRDTVGMILRGIHGGVILLSVIGIGMWLIGEPIINILKLLYFIPLFSIKGVIYGFFGTPKKYENFVIGLRAGKTKWENLAPTQKSEMATGVLLSCIMILVFTVFSF